MVSAKLVYAATLLSLAVAAQNGNGGARGAVANGGARANANAGNAAKANAGNANGGNAAKANAGNGNANTATTAAATTSTTAAANNKGGNKGAAAASASSASAAAASAAAASASAAAASANNAKANTNNNNNNNNNANNAATNTNNNAADSTTLSANAIQSGSFFDGSNGLGAVTGQALSTTSQNNFINFCSGQTLTNGLQITGGSCNGIVMGQIPAKAKMVSTVITFPKNGQSIQAGQDFNITLQVDNLQAGAFTNADATYYAAPQQLQNGIIVGHVHVTVQDMGNSLNPTSPLDPTAFAFFKGIDDAGDGNGGLSAQVAGGLPAGNYRVCTLTSSANHQPVIMPVAQRGSQDDCTKFTVTGNGGTTNIAANDGSKGQAAAALAQSAVDLGPGAITTAAAAAANTATTAAASTTTAATNNNNKGGNTNKNTGKKAQRLARFRSRTFVA